MSGVYFQHENHYDHILVGCPELCTKEFWDLRDVMLVTIVASIIIQGVEAEK